VSGEAERTPVRRRRGVAAALYAGSLIALASFGFGRAWEPLVAALDSFLQSVAVFHAAQGALTEALTANARFPRALPALPHSITVYPILALRHNEQGDVLLQVLVEPDGQVGDVRIVQSSGHAQLDAAALIGVGYWYYVPAVRNHQAVESWILVRIRFRIPENSPSTS
jgi:TonB family protein